MYLIKEVRLEATYLCNQKCKHCYALDMTPNTHGKNDLLNLEDGVIVDLLRRLHGEHGTERLSITGGEVLLPSIAGWTLSLVKFARSLGMSVRIMTNGMLLTDELIAGLKDAAGEARTVTLQISVDSSSESIHDEFRGIPGALRRTLEGIKRAKVAGFITHVRYSLREDEVSDAVSTYKDICSLGVDAFIVKPVFASGRARSNHSLVAQKDTIREAQLRLAEATCGQQTPLKLAQPIMISDSELAPGSNVQLTECNCGKTGVTIDQNGNVLPCNFISGLENTSDWVLGNVLDPAFDLLEEWNKEGTFAWYREDRTSKGTCPSYGVTSCGCQGKTAACTCSEIPAEVVSRS